MVSALAGAWITIAAMAATVLGGGVLVPGPDLVKNFIHDSAFRLCPADTHSTGSPCLQIETYLEQAVAEAPQTEFREIINHPPLGVIEGEFLEKDETSIIVLKFMGDEQDIEDKNRISRGLKEHLALKERDKTTGFQQFYAHVLGLVVWKDSDGVVFGLPVQSSVGNYNLLDTIQSPKDFFLNISQPLTQEELRTLKHHIRRLRCEDIQPVEKVIQDEVWRKQMFRHHFMPMNGYFAADPKCITQACRKQIGQDAMEEYFAGPHGIPCLSNNGDDYIKYYTRTPRHPKRKRLRVADDWHMVPWDVREYRESMNFRQRAHPNRRHH